MHSLTTNLPFVFFFIYCILIFLEQLFFVFSTLSLNRKSFMESHLMKKLGVRSIYRQMQFCYCQFPNLYLSSHCEKICSFMCADFVFLHNSAFGKSYILSDPFRLCFINERNAMNNLSLSFCSPCEK